MTIYLQYPYTICFLFNEDMSKVLLLNRNKKPWMGCWNGIGGKLETGVDLTPLNGVIREIQEEAGFKDPINELKFLKSGGKMQWFFDNDEDNHEMKGTLGMYVFYGKVDSQKYEEYFNNKKTGRCVPYEFDEGILDFKNVDWVQKDLNLGIVPSIKIIIQKIVSGEISENSLFRSYFASRHVISRIDFIENGSS